MKKIIIFNTILICICICLSCNVTKYRTSLFDINNIEIIEKDSLVLKNYVWTKCAINEKDTVIILFDKINSFSEMQNQVTKIEKIYSIINNVGYRLYNNDIYIDGKLYFAKVIEVYCISY